MSDEHPKPHRLILPTPGGIQAAQQEMLDALEQTQIALLFDLLESDITFDGLQISTDWLDPAQGAGTPAALRQAQMVDDAINRAYPPGDLATIKIEGLVLSRAAVRWLRALRMRSSLGSARDKRGTSTLTRIALIKA